MWSANLVVLVFAAAVPMTAQELVFSANVDGNWDLFHWKSGSPLRRLSATVLDERSPILSPNRSQVAFVTSQGAIEVVNLNSGMRSGLRLPPGRYGWPEWLSENEIACTLYQAVAGGEASHILRYRLADGAISDLLTQKVPIDQLARDSRTDRVAYVMTVETRLEGHDPYFGQELAITSLQTGFTQLLPISGTAITRPSWSPDGHRLLLNAIDSERRALVHTIAVGPGQQPRVSASLSGGSSAVWFGSGTIAETFTETERSGFRLRDLAGRPVRTVVLFDHAVDLADLAVR